MPKARPRKSPDTQRQGASPWLTQHGPIERQGGVDINRGGSPLCRWRAAGEITPTQDLAIQHVLRLWDLAGIPLTPVTAGYGERVAGWQGDEPERLANARLDAADDLARIQGYVPLPYWQVFENCIRWDEPGGRAGSKLMGWNERNSAQRALTVVQFVADVICMNERLVA